MATKALKGYLRVPHVLLDDGEVASTGKQDPLFLQFVEYTNERNNQ